MSGRPTLAADQLRATLGGPIPALDGVSGLAILAVLMHQLLLDRPALGAGAGRLVGLGLAPFEAGWVGVQLFFVLSGFLITGILLDSRGAQNYLSSFFARRALRIFPLYYLLLALVFVVIPVLGTLPAPSPAQHHLQGWYWSYLQNWTFLRGGGYVRPLGSCWSLAVEEQFYLVWPFVVRAVSDRGLARVSIAVAIGALALRAGVLAAGGAPEVVYECTLTRADALTLGALLAVVVRRPDWLARLTPRLGLCARLVAAALLATALGSGGLSRHNPLAEVAGETLVALISAILILYVTLETAQGSGKLASWLASPLLRRFGKHSYAIYLVHLPLHLLLVRRVLGPALAGAGLETYLLAQGAYLALGPFALLALGMFIYRVVEEPFLRLKRGVVTRHVAAA